MIEQTREIASASIILIIVIFWLSQRESTQNEAGDVC